MFKSKRGLITTATVVILVLVIVIVVVSSRHSSSTSQNTPKQNPLPNPHPPKEAIATVQQYARAREDSVGADQSSPYNWVNQVQNILTPQYYAELQPKVSSTGNALGDYNTAHTYDFLVRADLSNCIWDFKVMLPTSSQGTIYCTLTDTVLYQSTGQKVPETDLPFGWTRMGESSITVRLVKINDRWLISDDLIDND